MYLYTDTHRLLHCPFVTDRYRFLPSGLEFDLYFRSPERASDLRVTLFQPVGLLHVIRLASIDPKQVRVARRRWLGLFRLRLHLCSTFRSFS